MNSLSLSEHLEINYRVHFAFLKQQTGSIITIYPQQQVANSRTSTAAPYLSKLTTQTLRLSIPSAVYARKRATCRKNPPRKRKRKKKKIVCSPVCKYPHGESRQIIRSSCFICACANGCGYLVP